MSASETSRIPYHLKQNQYVAQLVARKCQSKPTSHKQLPAVLPESLGLGILDIADLPVGVKKGGRSSFVVIMAF